jgi:hypothetical protein
LGAEAVDVEVEGDSEVDVDVGDDVVIVDDSVEVGRMVVAISVVRVKVLTMTVGLKEVLDDVSIMKINI